MDYFLGGRNEKCYQQNCAEPIHQAGQDPTDLRLMASIYCVWCAQMAFIHPIDLVVFKLVPNLVGVPVLFVSLSSLCKYYHNRIHLTSIRRVSVFILGSCLHWVSDSNGRYPRSTHTLYRLCSIALSNNRRHSFDKFKFSSWTRLKGKVVRQQSQGVVGVSCGSGPIKNLNCVIREINRSDGFQNRPAADRSNWNDL